MKAILMRQGSNFQVVDLNRNLTQFRSSEIHYLRDPTARLHEMVFWTCDNQICERLISSVFLSVRKAILKNEFSIKLPSLKC